jgi:hydroxymethylglutaryl-CoA lyase
MSIAALPHCVNITEVGTRDGFQALPCIIPTQMKIDVINSLIEAGVRSIEATSFVSPRAVPQLADAAEVIAGIKRRPDVIISCLAPNIRGAERACAAKVDEMALIISASESHNKKNLNRSIEESISGFRAIADIANSNKIRLRGGIATSFGCPFEGDISAEKVADLASAFANLGIYAVTFGDTTGMATPPIVTAVCNAVRSKSPKTEIALHFHDTRGTGLVNVMTGLQLGITDYESSVGGIGGCPFAPGATGNICTEDLIYLFHELGVTTHIDMNAVVEIAKKIEQYLKTPLPGHIMKAGNRLSLSSFHEARHAVG